jgi:hypothetical protein
MDICGGRATVGAIRLENGQSFDRPEIKTERASHAQAKGHFEQTRWSRAEGKDWKDLA